MSFIISFLFLLEVKQSDLVTILSDTIDLGWEYLILIVGYSGKPYSAQYF